jgi:hypothetical protein
MGLTTAYELQALVALLTLGAGDLAACKTMARSQPNIEDFFDGRPVCDPAVWREFLLATCERAADILREAKQ